MLELLFGLHLKDSPRLMIVEAQGRTVRRILNMSYYKEVDFDVYSAPLDWTSVCDSALQGVGTEKYGYIDALWVGVREKMSVMFNMKLPHFKFSGQICSEFVASLYRINPSEVSPQGLVNELESRGITTKMCIRNVK